MSLDSTEVEIVESGAPEWDSLPLNCLVQIFDDLLRAPTPHPSYLMGKLKSWSALFRTCSHWKRAIIETGVGVCLPKTLDTRMIEFLKRARIRGLELHDPDHTDQTVISLLGDPNFLSSSSQSMQSIVDVPFAIGGPWRPCDFTNLSHLTIRNPHHQGPLPTVPVSNVFDCKAVSGMKNLRVLVLAAGFNRLENLASLPDTCKQMMINCPGQPQTSHLSITEWPASISLEWFSISTHTLQIDFSALKGVVKQLHVHAAFVFLESSEGGRGDSSAAAAKKKLKAVAETILHDSSLMEAQLTCEVVVVGSKPLDYALNTLMLSGSPMVDISSYYTEVSNNDVEGALLGVYNALLAEKERAPGGDTVQLECAQYGPELELTLVRQKEGEKGSLALRLDAIGIDPELEVEKLITELQDELHATRGQPKKSPYSSPYPQSGLFPESFACNTPSSTTYRSVTFPRWSYEEGEEEGDLDKFYDACEDLSLSKALDSEASNAFEECEGASSLSPSPVKASVKSGKQLPISAHLGLSTRLLSSSSFLESSRDFLTEVNGLLVPHSSLRPYYPSLHSLLNPYFALTALFCTTLGDRSRGNLLPDSCFPTTLQELYLTAGMKGQRFSCAAIENLVELRRLNLRGYSSFDLQSIPALRPGLCLVISDTECSTRPSLPSSPMASSVPQPAPIGSKVADGMIPRGKIIEVSVNITLSDPQPPGGGGAEAQRRGGGMIVQPPSNSHGRASQVKKDPTPLDVDVLSWSPIAHGLHAQALSGVNLHASSCNSPSSFMDQLIKDGLDHMVVVTTVLMPANQLLAVPGSSKFKLILDNGERVVDGLELLFAVSQNKFPAWQVQWNFEGQGADEDEDEDPEQGGEGQEGEAAAAGAGAGAGAEDPFAGINMGQAIQEFLAHQAAQGNPPPAPHQVQAALQVLQAIQAAHPGGQGMEMRSRVICIAFHRRPAGAEGDAAPQVDV